jgi:predicted AAA+ superfamily ATPase
MPHSRPRFAASLIRNAQTFWPVVGVVGPRQSGKTTLLRDQVTYQSFASLDDDDIRASANHSSKLFLAQYERPLVIDEITKAPNLFDGIKLVVDKKRIPNQFLVTGSAQFSTRLGIRESLTGRIGMIRLNPLTLAEASGKSFRGINSIREPQPPGRFTLEQVMHHCERGGMPVPMFIREKHLVDDYWRAWLDTTIYRDVARLFQRGFDPEFAFDLLNQIGRALADGEIPTLSHFHSKNVRKMRNYLEAFETVFLVRRMRCHELGVGKDSYMFFDSGLAHHMIKTTGTEGAILSLARHFLLNETSTMIEIQKRRDDRSYFKSAKGTPVDWIMDGVPFKVVTTLKSIGWAEKGLLGAMKKLESKNGYLIAPIEKPTRPDKSSGIGVLPWSFWS